MVAHQHWESVLGKLVVINDSVGSRALKQVPIFFFFCDRVWKKYSVGPRGARPAQAPAAQLARLRRGLRGHESQLCGRWKPFLVDVAEKIVIFESFVRFSEVV